MCMNGRVCVWLVYFYSAEGKSTKIARETLFHFAFFCFGKFFRIVMMVSTLFFCHSNIRMLFIVNFWYRCVVYVSKHFRVLNVETTLVFVNRNQLIFNINLFCACTRIIFDYILMISIERETKQKFLHSPFRKILNCFDLITFYQ